MGLFNLSRQNHQDSDRLGKLFDQLDLSTDIPAQNGPFAGLQGFVRNLQQRISTSLHAAVGIAAHAPPLAAIARTSETHGQQLAQSSELIASAIEEISTTLEAELVPGAVMVAGLAEESRIQLCSCETDSQLVLAQVNTIQDTESQLAEEIQRLGKQIDEVTQVIGMIASISQQTNLLALNAAIEAARAGEQGRGFAVVADEVRRLAGHTTDATDQVSQIIEGFRGGMQRLTKAGESMHKAIAEGRDGILRVDQGLTKTAQAMDQLDQRMAGMASGTEQIGAAVRSLSHDVQSIADVAGQLENAATRIRKHSEAVRSESDHLLEGLGNFKLTVHQQIHQSVCALAAEPALCSSLTQAEQLMQRSIAQDSRFELMYLVAADGTQVSENILASGLPSQGSMRGKNWSDRTWFREVRNTLQAFISPVYRSSATDAFCFTLSAPVFDHAGQLRYVLGVDIRLSALLSQGASLTRQSQAPSQQTANTQRQPVLA